MNPGTVMGWRLLVTEHAIVMWSISIFSYKWTARVGWFISHGWIKYSFITVMCHIYGGFISDEQRSAYFPFFFCRGTWMVWLIHQNNHDYEISRMSKDRLYALWNAFIDSDHKDNTTSCSFTMLLCCHNQMQRKYEWLVLFISYLFTKFQMCIQTTGRCLVSMENIWMEPIDY